MTLAVSANDRSEAESLRGLLRQRQLHPIFQPIIDTLSGQIIGHEALIRGPAGHALEYPNDIFRVAQQHQLLSELEISCREAAFNRFHQSGMSDYLFLNINPNVLREHGHPQGCTLAMAKQLGISAKRVVIELSEKYPVDDPGILKVAIQRYRDAGFLIAIDDLGSGYSGLQLWSELRPDYVKIDRYFIANIHRDAVKREFVQSILGLARAMHAKVIAEGIESIEELRQLQQLGIHICQGFLLGRPQSEPLVSLPTEQLAQLRSRANAQTETIGLLQEVVPTVTPPTPALAVLDMFIQEPELLSLPVVDGLRAVGLVRRERLMELFSGSYGRALYANKAVTRVMDSNPLIVEFDTPLDHVSQLITEDHQIDVSRQLLITKDGCYQGVASVRNLLRKITDLRIQNARYANPLTLLPGNVPIYREIDKWLGSGNAFRVAYFDLNNFKPYNDVYGYGNGDKLLQWVGGILREEIHAQGHFVGHIGGDDFVAIFAEESKWRQHCDKVIQRFEHQIQQFYTQKDVRRGGIVATTRTKGTAFYALLGIAIGVVKPDPTHCLSHHDVAVLASEAKKQAKQAGKSICFVSRRRRPAAQVSDHADQGAAV